MIAVLTSYTFHTTRFYYYVNKCHRQEYKIDIYRNSVTELHVTQDLQLSRVRIKQQRCRIINADRSGRFYTA